MKLSILIFLFGIAGTISAQNGTAHAADSVLRCDSMVLAYLHEEGVTVTTDNKIKLLKSGQEKFEDLFATINRARYNIHLEYFNFRNDSIANALFNLLSVKAKEGVEVRTLFDAFGNWSNSRPLQKKHLEKIRSRGIEIYHFDQLKFPYLNHVFHRDHRKIAVIDGRVAYTGGMNIADYYIKGLPEIGDWRDMHMRIEGGAVKFLQDIFLEMWNRSTKHDVGGKQYYSQPDISSQAGISVAIVDRSPKKLPKLLRHTYIKSIQAANRKIQIVNPYFLPPRSVKRALKDALARGVEIEILLSSKSDIPLTPEGSIYVAWKLLKRGAHVYLYNGGFHHSKIMMVDDTFCTVGTANLDSRSLRYDYEVNAFIFDGKITGELVQIFNDDKKNCTILTPEIWKKRSVWKRFSGWFANVLTPFL